MLTAIAESTGRTETITADASERRQPHYQHMVVGGKVVSVLVDEVRYTKDGRIIAVTEH